ncbi:MAG: glycosyltransferase family 39 protein [Bacteroidota bacterium]
MKAKYLYTIWILCFLGITLFLTFNRHSKSGYFNYHSEIWADKAGYYVYLPAAFKFNFNPENFPDSIDVNTGNGFTLDEKNGKVITKYTYGVALMQLPFFYLAELLADPLNFERNGFSPIYHWSINVASVFYLVLGLFFLYKFLNTRFDKRSSLLTILSIFLATNLYYYSIDETGMSHIYSFSLFCMFLYFLQITNYLKKHGYWKSLIFGLLMGLIILIRPTNILFLSTFFFLDINDKTDIFSRIKRLINYKVLIPILFGVFVIILPQLLYWNYTSGLLINYSYDNEGFNWLSPRFLNTWLSPNNGLFLYTPFYFLIIGSLFLMIRNKKVNGIFILILFLTISYTFSSWWAWSFGCSFGARSYVEYLSIFSIPVAYSFYEIRKLKTIKIISFSIIILVFIAFNLKMIYSYDGCFYGKKDWDWNTYIELIESPTK